MNLKNRTIFCNDNLDVLKGINSTCVDLIYLDPPFNKNKVFSSRLKKNDQKVSFNDIFKLKDIKDEWLQTIEKERPHLSIYLKAIQSIGKPYNIAYCTYMSIRLIECYRILKETGSLYLHCDQTMSHHLKIILDCIFGEENFRNEIYWQRNKSTISDKRTKKFGKQTDNLLWYTKSNDFYTKPYRSYTEEEKTKKFYLEDKKGRYEPLQNHFYLSKGKINKDKIQGRYQYKKAKPTYGVWTIKKENLIQLDQEGLIEWYQDGSHIYKNYMESYRGKHLTDLWTDIDRPKGKESIGYPTQKPLALLHRIIQCHTKKHDVVLDPFCGGGTTLIAAEQCDRQWIGIDFSQDAYRIIKERLKRESNYDGILPFYPITTETKPPIRTN